MSCKKRLNAIISIKVNEAQVERVYNVRATMFYQFDNNFKSINLDRSGLFLLE